MMINKFVKSLLIVLLILYSCITAYAQDDIQIIGNTYIVNSAAGLNWISEVVNETTEDLSLAPVDTSFAGKIILLRNDISIDAYEWVPIGLINDFKGLFDGNNYSVNNLKIQTKTANDKAGLFGNVSATIIKNLNISNATLKGNKYCGILAVNAIDTQIKNSSVDGIIISGNTAEIGGICNYISGKVYNCSSVVTIMTGINSKVGGITQAFSGKLSSCESTVDIRGEPGSQLAGITSQATGRLINCNSMGDIKGGSVIGGIVSKMNSSASLQASTFDGTLEGDNIVGGIVALGLDSITIDIAKNKGNIENGKLIGGIVGQLNNDTKMFNCESSGSISSYIDNGKIGGLIGEILGTSKIMNSYSISNLLGNNIIGGLVGEMAVNSEIRYCYSAGNINVAPGMLGGSIGKVFNEYTTSSDQSGIYYNTTAQYMQNGENANNKVGAIGNILKSKPVIPVFDMSGTWLVSDDGTTTVYNLALFPDWALPSDEAQPKYIKLYGFNGIDNMNNVVSEFNDFIKYEGRYVLSKFIDDTGSVINNGFPYLENRVIIDNEESETPLQINEIYFENGLYIVNLTGELPSQAVIVLGAYDSNNKFVGIRHQYISLENNYSFDYTGESIYKLKALVFEDYNTMKPLCTYKEFGGN